MADFPINARAYNGAANTKDIKDEAAKMGDLGTGETEGVESEVEGAGTSPEQRNITKVTGERLQLPILTSLFSLHVVC